MRLRRISKERDGPTIPVVAIEGRIFQNFGSISFGRQSVLDH